MPVYVVPVPGLERQLTVEPGAFHARFFLDGAPLKAERGKVELWLGGETVAVRTAPWFGLSRQDAVLVGNERIAIGPRIPLAIYILALLPLVLFFGGVVGGFIAGLTIPLNLWVAKRPRHPVVRASVIAMTFVVAMAVYVMVAGFLLDLS